MEPQKQLPRHKHRPLIRLLFVTLGLAVATYALSFYGGSIINVAVNGFIISDIVITSFVLALVWALVLAVSLTEACTLHGFRLLRSHKAGCLWVLWGSSLIAGWLVFLLILRLYIILNVMRFS